jgi:negative regulator of sigma E activity
MRPASPPSRAALALVAAVLGLVAAVPARAQPAGQAVNPLDQARRAVEVTSFVGVLQVRWRDAVGENVEHVTVQGAGGSVVVRGGNQVMARPGFERLVAHEGDAWAELWLPQLGPLSRPDPSLKYDLVTSAGPVVAGRATEAVEVREGGMLREVLQLDSETGLLVGRRQYDPQGREARAMAFEALAVDVSTLAPELPSRPANHAPVAVSATRLAPAMAPAELADGYRRIGLFRDQGHVQLIYSDGLYDLSVFEQPGTVRGADLPPHGERVSVASRPGWRYSWAGGQVVVWGAGGTVYTAISDAPVDQVLLAAASIPGAATARPSLLDKLHRACAVLLKPLD